MSILFIIIGIIIIFVAIVTTIIASSGALRGLYEFRNYIFAIALCIFGIFFIILGTFML